MNMESNIEIVFNHYYILRHDMKRTYIQSREINEYSSSLDVNEYWLSKIHPVYAMIFSFLSSPKSLSDFCSEVSYFLDISVVDVKKLIQQFINNPEPIMSEFGNVQSIFPKNIIIKSTEKCIDQVDYCPEQFKYDEIDFVQERIYLGPLNLVLMVNNTCVTDCVYCYADKKTKHTLFSLERLSEVLDEAQKIGIRKIDLTGGELFCNKNWQELLNLLIEKKYHPGLISTKVPLRESTIKEIVKYKLAIQISLDSLDDNMLMTMLNVKAGYSSKIQSTIKLLEKYSITFQISTVITSYNCSIENLKAIYTFLNNFTHIRRWEIRIAFKSLYSRQDFEILNIDFKTIKKIDAWIDQIKKTSKLLISWDTSGFDRYFKSQTGSKDFIGSRCSASYSNMVILPDGKVTICEQLYWTPDFIIGDITKQSISEIWNSPQALKLAFPKREDFRDQSICKTCKIFDECYSFPNKCILDVIKGYGIENKDYPDPRCAKAPKFIHELRPFLNE